MAVSRTAICDSKVGFDCTSWQELPKLNTIKCGENSFRRASRLSLRCTIESCSPSVFPSLVDFSCDTQAFSHCDLQPIASLCRCIDSPADLSKLESIRFGDTTFLHTPLFYLANLEKLRVVTFGPRSFFNVVTMHFASGFQCRLATRPPFSGDD